MPSEWQEKILGDLITLEYGAGLPESSRFGSGFPVYGSSGIVGQHSNYLVNGSGIVIGRKGTVGAVAWSEGPFWPIDTTYYVLKRGEVETRWCYWLLQTIGLDRLNSSTGVPGLNRNDAYSIWAKVPPLPEQRRIAEILDTIDEAIQKTEALISKLKAMKQGLLHDLLTRGLDKNGKLRDPKAHPEQFKDSTLGRIPKEWAIGGIHQFLSPTDGIKPGPFGSSITKRMYSAEGYKVYGQEQVIADDLTVGDYYIPPDKFNELRIFEIHENDILVSLVGTVGCVLVVRRPFKPGIINPRLIRFRPILSKGTPVFLKELLMSDIVKGQLASLFQGGTMPVLSATTMRKLILAKPKQYEQEMIAKVLVAHDTRIRAEERYRDKLKFQKKGLMHDLLTGKVRVKK